ncbi:MULTISPECIES: protein-export chaperone SecB [unclassified Pasteurella]|uniref:protein-export chaperone SecB n=1 Tax=unclassified Pasteurella TaxID=2621516 RepID=UPI001073AE29|nr:protein-export chaperone SecB [Pasteurella sp. 19428wF3_WM03]TFU50848.1 hypothetical protein E4T92_07690 [Pasteurella sp. WM03]
MKLFLESTKVLGLQFLSDSIKDMFGYEPKILDKQTFAINFKFSHSHKDGISIELEYQAIFKVDSESHVDETLLDNPFLHVNAPAIAYPFLRAYVSNLFLMSGYAPLMLPSVNFDEAWKKRKKG